MSAKFVRNCQMNVWMEVANLLVALPEKKSSNEKKFSEAFAR